MQRIYFDHNATTVVLPEVRESVLSVMSQAYNPSSVHYEGRQAKLLVEDARRSVAKLFCIDLRDRKHEVVFTSSATEANNMVFASTKNMMVITAETEHSSVLRAAAMQNGKVKLVSVDESGIINLSELEHILSTAESPCLISIMAANNETGVVQPLEEIVAVAKKYNATLHTDAVQVPGKLQLDLSDFDFISCSGHKCGGLAGVGALIYNSKMKLLPLFYGGGQEKNLRAGTENIAGIAAFGKAFEWNILNSGARQQRLLILRNLLEKEIRALNGNAKIFGSSAKDRLCNTSMIMMPGISAQKQLILFDIEGFAVSAGSACSSGKVASSQVLKAMGVSEAEAACAIRVSLSHTNTEAEIIRFVEVWNKIATMK